MSVNALVQTRIDIAVKEEAAHVLAAMGLTVSDAVRLLLTRIATEKQLHFAPMVPNAATIAAIKESRLGKVSKADNMDGFVRAMHAND